MYTQEKSAVGANTQENDHFISTLYANSLREENKANLPGITDGSVPIRFFVDVVAKVLHVVDEQATAGRLDADGHEAGENLPDAAQQARQVAG